MCLTPPSSATSVFRRRDIFQTLTGPVFATEHASRDASTLDILAFVTRGIPRVSRLPFPAARIKSAVEALPLVYPKLELTCLSRSITAKRGLRWSVMLQLIHDLTVGDIAHLPVLLDD